MNKRIGYGVSGNMSALGAVDVGSNPATLIQFKRVKCYYKTFALKRNPLNIIRFNSLNDKILI
jgi:hypothetical protein